MSSANLLWVLGHQIRPLDTDETYGLVEVTSLPKVPGPPPHFHKDEREFFLIQSGVLDVMADGKWQSMGPGAYLELPPRTLHTFINNTDTPAVWITGWRPKGFERFFHDFGVPAGEGDARDRSTSAPVVGRVVATCERYGMFVGR